MQEITCNHISGRFFSTSGSQSPTNGSKRLPSVGLEKLSRTMLVSFLPLKKRKIAQIQVEKPIVNEPLNLNYFFTQCMTHMAEERFDHLTAFYFSFLEKWDRLDKVTVEQIKRLSDDCVLVMRQLISCKKWDCLIKVIPHLLEKSLIKNPLAETFTNQRYALVVQNMLILRSILAIANLKNNLDFPGEVCNESCSGWIKRALWHLEENYDLYTEVQIVEIYRHAAVVSLKEKDFQGALKFAKKIEKFNVGVAFFIKGYVLLKLHHYQKALKSFYTSQNYLRNLSLFQWIIRARLGLYHVIGSIDPIWQQFAHIDRRKLEERFLTEMENHTQTAR